MGVKMGVKMDDRKAFVRLNSHERSELTSPFNYRFNSPLNKRTMKRILMVLAATVICGACLFTSCKKDEEETPANLNVAEKIIGKWIIADRDGQPLTTNKKMLVTFASATKAYMSESLNSIPEAGTLWNDKMEADVTIVGNKVTLTFHRNEHHTGVHEYIFTDINDREFFATQKTTSTVDGVVMHTFESTVRFTKVTADYSADIIGTWQGHCTSTGSVFDDGQEHRWQYNADGNFVYYVKDGDNWVPSANTLNQYFVDGNLLCTRWVDNGEEHREWWEITIDGSQMHWTALREDENGQRFTATFEMSKVN